MITDEMVMAYVMTSSIAPGDNEARIKAGLEAALAAGEPVAWRVKPLEWNPYRAETAFGYYHIDDQRDRADELRGRLPFLLSGSRLDLARYDTLEDAKAAAQADYEARILSAKDTTPVAGEVERLETMAPQAHVEVCERCQGNGEIVTDWDRYMRGHEDENGNEAVAECPDCDGEGMKFPIVTDEMVIAGCIAAYGEEFPKWPDNSIHDGKMMVSKVIRAALQDTAPPAPPTHLRGALTEIVAASEKVLQGLHARIDAADKRAVPVFYGIVDLSDALHSAKAALTTATKGNGNAD